ncbi:LacI family DNA-binding transcriptional regulator [Jiangella asiatica]|uniref:LacI family transcriptional regulator n=1 Tax=Jiangella asiatica TaxID=2530372 RepID=A0A4R5DDE3_9ACTN|nr:substrate-binding domain-containing protein [Jiangella asiatica]TDE09861.1 LacI family transcriptional regulator [Jiangella asiatica]
MTVGLGRSQRAGIRQVADRAGVSVSSVSRVLTSHPDVSARMRKRVLEAVEQLGYEPDWLAQSMRRGATLTVGFVVGDISNPLFAQIALGAEVSLQREGYSMLLANSQNQPVLDARHIRLFQQRRVDGLLLSLASENHTETLEALAGLETPIVLIDRDLPPAVAASAVLSDHQSGMRAAAASLIELGHRRIGMITGSIDLRPSREREAALRAVCAEHPEVGAVVRPGSFTAAHGAAATAELLDGADPPTALVAGGNQILIGVLRELRARGLSVPSDISLVSCDEVPLSELYDPPIATIVRDPFRIGQRAAELLLGRLRGDQPHHAVLPSMFAPGRSCGPPR